MDVNLIKLGRAALLTSTLLVAPATSHATMLVPGGVAVPDLFAEPAGTLLAQDLSPLISGGNLIANLRAAVVMDTQAYAVPPRIFATDVFFRAGSGGLGFFRENGSSLDGVHVAFDFIGRCTSFALNADEVSQIMVVRTDATQFSPDGLTDITPSSAFGRSFEPREEAVSAVPEPASLLLLGSAFAAAGYVARHRVARKKSMSV